MKTLSPSLKASFESDASTLCRIITITLKNGTVLRLTDLDRSVKVGAFTYRAAGIQQSAIRQSLIGGGDGGSLTFFLPGEDTSGELITLDMVRRKLLSGARYVTEAIDYRHPEYGTMILSVGTFGPIEFNERGQCTIDLLGITTSRSITLGELYSQECRNDFGDQFCKYPVETLRVNFTIEEVLNYQMFRVAVLADEEDGAWDYGTVRFEDGDNLNTVIEVAYSLEDGTIVLALPPPFEIEVGDAASIVPGCSKQRSQCRGDYNNILNYRGEPDVPTIDQQQIPIASSESPPPSINPSHINVRPWSDFDKPLVFPTE